MARIGENAFRQYRDGQDRLTAPEYMAERELIRLAINDTEDKVERVESIREEFSNTVGEVEAVKGDIIQTKQEVETRLDNFSQTVASKEEVQQVSEALNDKALKTEVQEVDNKLANATLDLKQREINIKQPPYNATTDNGRNVVSIINQAISDANANGGGVVYLPDGVYSVAFSTSNIMVQMKSNVELKLANNAVIKALPNSSAAYAVVQCKDISNFKITGGAVIGERFEHTGTTGEWGNGINLLGVSDFVIEKVKINECWGDAIYLSNSDLKSFCEDGKIIDVSCDRNRRQGISFISGKNIKIIRPVLKNTYGFPPSAGIDFEPNLQENLLQGIVVDSPYTENNEGQGIVAALQFYQGSTNDVDISIINHTDIGSVRGLELTQLRTPTQGKIKVTNPYWKNNKMNGLMVSNWSAFGIQVDIVNPTIINPNEKGETGSTYGSGILINREPNHTTGASHVGNVNIYSPIIKDIRSVPKMTSGIVVRDFFRPDQFTKNVSIIDPIEISGYGANTNARMWYSCESGGFISDKRRVLEHDLAETSLTIGLLTPHSVIHNSTSTTPRTVSLGANLPVSWRVTVEVRSANQIRINPPSTETIHPLGSLGKGIISSRIGSKVTLRKLNSTSWIIEEMVGAWEALT